ncbi:MAG: 50S ribosomal protein L3 [Pelagibacteraceae bacterium TMED124]|nr:MAG: 50S ribosomal protein L3 [Pelagibacteraceae bacterium TMED124]|tara:strand:+ start:2012 stop:2803 length:792 start_codon:yes stop_codon:yes gene_type:complete
MSLGLVGKKIGMTREFFDSGISIPVTVVKIEKGRVIDVYTKEKNGYSAVKLGFLKVKNSKLTNQMKGFYAKKNTEPKKIIKEYRVDKPEEFKAGNEIGLEVFKDVKFIDVRSKTIGKGFAGVMKKYNFAGLRATHGVSVSHRSHGSTGQRQDPGRVFKGKKMAGHMGSKFRTILNLEVIKSDPENNLLYIKGSIPGSKNSLVYLRKSTKTFSRKTSAEKFSFESKSDAKQETKVTPKKPESKKPEVKKPEAKKTTTNDQNKKK